MNKLDYTEFYDYVWGEYISPEVVPDSYFEKNSELIQHITYDYHMIYEKTPNGSETHFAKLIEIVFKNFISFGQFKKNNNLTNEAFESFED